MKNKIKFLIIFISFLSSCQNSNDSNLKNKLFTEEDEAWGVYSKYDNFGFSSLYYKFYPDVSFDKFQSNGKILTLFNDDGDLVSDKKFRKWNISNDSVFTWSRHKYRIILINEKVLLLSYGTGSDMLLLKEKTNNLRAPEYKYEEINKK